MTKYTINDSCIGRAIKHIGGVKIVRSRLHNLAIDVTQKEIRKWISDGKIPPEHSRSAIAIESLVNNNYSVVDLCPDVFAGMGIL